MSSSESGRCPDGNRPSPRDLGDHGRPGKEIPCSTCMLSKALDRSNQKKEQEGPCQPKLPVLKRRSLVNVEGAAEARLPARTGRRDAGFSIRATLRKVSRSNHTREEAIYPRTSLAPKTSPSVERLNKTARLAPRPSHVVHTASGRLLINHKSDGELERSYAQLDPQSSISRANQAGHAATPSRHRQPPCYTDSQTWGRTSWSKTAAQPVVSPAPAHARDITRSGRVFPANHNRSRSRSDGVSQSQSQNMSSSSQSWGRRAAAAALDIGRRWRERGRKASSGSRGGYETGTAIEENGTSRESGGDGARAGTGGQGPRQWATQVQEGPPAEAGRRGE
ncbi:uncharacterized protein THITE_158613 [Thermothielavioides terrestris NRRL 8126]|uniref:Uncharacterized protein n=1 Tax=Thermothielavioides terrestris (strain ATCC 38088 / NRRL 8126) TaxID=578455 RepID=G2QVW4_THETT|nr:uncharacterized protein THITE_158613 [Thermothielavioides terrestris NRRL 8126]AEO64696.1 hypothetical protein THITE_158613 [Thermothielavioides terrestris NRRL 8126]